MYEKSSCWALTPPKMRTVSLRPGCSGMVAHRMGYTNRATRNALMNMTVVVSIGVASIGVEGVDRVHGC
jgi:hypothetical protein